MSDHDVDPGSERIQQLILELSDFQEGRCCEAQFSLIALGPTVVQPLLRAVTTMAPTGQLHAMDVFEELEDARTGPTLIALLGSDDGTVREWAAHALGVLKIQNAVPALVRAYRATRDRGTQPDWTEAVSMRHAMSALGARDPVVPTLTRSFQLQVPKLGTAWPADRLHDVIEDLADHDQVVLYFQLLRVEGDHAYHVGDAGGSWGAEVDHDQPWPKLVRHAKEWAGAALCIRNQP